MTRIDTGLSIRLFAGVSLTLSGQPLTELPTRKAEALLVYLVCHERPFSREQLADLLWDDRPQDQALANLRSILSSLRRSLRPYLTITRQTVAFNHESSYWLDTAEFAKEIETWKLESGSGETAPPYIQSLERAISLYTGDFLAGFHLRESRGFEEWAILERERWQRQAILLTRSLAEHHLHQGQFYLAVRMARRLLQLDDLSETSHRLLILTLARNGELSAALAQYQACRQILVEELGVSPSPETAVLHDRIRVAFHTPRHNLPPQPTPFVGRELELEQIQAQLTNPDCRLLTILGTGGIGKTRLAIAAAARMTSNGRFLNGVRFAALATIQSPRFLPTALANALGITFQGSDAPIDQIITYLRPLEMLLILDNLEQLLEEPTVTETITLLTRILQEAPLLTLLVTSRQRLQLYEEWVFDVHGLAFPSTDMIVDVGQFSAVQLFLQTAHRAQRAFTTPTTVELADVARVCHMLEGMPLGIELAAAWIRHLSCADIAHQLQAGSDFLTTSLRNVPPRHRSLTAVFDHSWQLLTHEEQVTFAQLAIFRGGFTAAAAQVIANAPQTILQTLFDKSLLRHHEDRYDMHEMLRQFAQEKLLATATTHAAVAARHADFYLSLLTAQEDVEGASERQIIHADLPNIRTAWEWAVQHHAYTALDRPAIVLHRFYSVQSWFQEGIALFAEALDELTPTETMTTVQASTLCEVLSRKAQMHIHIGQLPAAKEVLDTAVSYLPAIDDPKHHSTVLGYLAITAYYAGEFDRAIALGQESLTLAAQANDADGVAFATNFLGSCAKAQGAYETARMYFKQAVAAYQEQDDPLGMTMSIHNLGNLAQAMGDYEEAQAHYLMCSRMFKELQHTHGAAATLVNAGKLAHKQGNLEQAAAWLHEGLTLKQELQDERGIAVALCGLGDVSLAVGDNEQAQTQLMAALSLAHKCGDVNLTMEALVLLSDLAQRRGAGTTAARLLTFVLIQPGVPQEVKVRAQPVQTLLDAAESKSAAVWVQQQTLAEIVAQIQDGLIL